MKTHRFSFLPLLVTTFCGGVSYGQTLIEASNIAEFIAGTDPGDRNDFLAITDLVRQGDTLTVTWPSVAGRVYEVFWSIDALNWTSISSRTGSGGLRSDDLDLNVIDAVDGSEGNLGRLFVRIGVDFAAAE